MLLHAFLVPALFAAVCPTPRGTFFALAQPNGFDTLYIARLDGYSDRVGHIGDLGAPAIRDIWWNEAEQSLYGISAPQSDDWQLVRISPSTGVGTIVALLPTKPQLGAIAFNYNDSRTYWLSEDGRLHELEMKTGLSFALGLIPESGHTGINYCRTLSYVTEFSPPANYSGLLTVCAQGNTRIIYGPPWRHKQIGNVGIDYNLFWELSSGSLFYYSTTQLFALNEVSGWQACTWRFDRSFLRMAFVPHEAYSSPRCEYTDSDYDGDIDLADFAHFQNCMTGP